MNNKVAIAFSTKNRTDFTKQTLPRILDEAEGNFDLYWLDGSDMPDGKQFPADFAYNWRREHDGKYPVKETHMGVGGGPAAVIQAALNYMHSKGCYDYIGLIENDVLLEPGWFEKTMGLFLKGDQVGCEGKVYKPGMVSARCFTHRILEKYDDYALMANVGAGMIIMRDDLVIPQLENWQTPILWVLQALCPIYLGHNYPLPPKVIQDDPDLKKTWMMVHDWWFEFVAWSRGYNTFACVPSLAINLDDPNGVRDRVER